ncbi:AMP-binding protein [Streptomyces sp. NPDC058107]|uniref:AMP-binding protein n=1 Tax=Streptomyces sp. NPDC058107 TaxID=3346343 RepID=UPI0036E9FEEA
MSIVELRQYTLHPGARETLVELFLIATGEALPPDLAADWLRRFPGIPMVNAYGPAECSDDTHIAVLSTPPPTDRAVPLGSPVAGVTSYVLDAQGRRLPFGLPGELAIGGPVVGRGYLGDPKATADRFVPDPYAARGGDGWADAPPGPSARCSCRPRPWPGAGPARPVAAGAGGAVRRPTFSRSEPWPDTPSSACAPMGCRP